MIRNIGFIVALALSAGMAQAQPVSQKDAQAQMFSTKGVSIQMTKLDFLSPENAALLQQIAEGYAYYAAIAIAPGEELLKSEATMLVANHHTSEAAAAAALASCNKARKQGPDCVIAALVRPSGWQARPLQLSIEATVALSKDYGRSGPRAMAISPVTGFFGLGQGGAAQAAAVAACAAKGASDCTVVVAD
jgi:hypothetical protein